jgi:hypothetical protein
MGVGGTRGEVIGAPLGSGGMELINGGADEDEGMIPGIY